MLAQNQRILLAALIGFTLAGCATPVARHAYPRITPTQDSEAGVVFPSQELVALGAAPDWEFARNDPQMHASAPQTLFEYDSWRSAPAPDLSLVRRVTITTRSPDTVTFFRRGQEQAARTYWGW